jgi:hypothetical protein
MRLYRSACLALALTLALCQLAAAQSVAAKYLPADTEVMFTINFEQILNSEIAQNHPQLVQHARDLLDKKLQETGTDQYLQKAGVDLFRDVRRLTVAGPGSKDADKVVVLIQGKFNAEKLKSTALDAAAANRGAIKITTLENQTVYEVAQPTGKTVYVVPIGDEYLVASPSRAVFAATVAQVRSGKATEAPTFKTLLETGADKQSLGLLATGAALTRLSEAVPNPNEMVAVYLKSVTGVNLGVTLTRDVQFQLGVSTADKETAEQFAKMGNALLIGARGMLQQKANDEVKLAPAVEVAQTLRIVTQDNSVMLRGEIGHDTIGKLLKHLPQQK